MADELNSPNHRWYIPRNNITLAPSDYSRHYIYDSGIQKIDAWINGGTPAPAFSPSTLYSSGSQGIWLDPSDLSTMFSDRAGTVPITTPGTVVGKRLDKSGRGNHAVAPTDAARPIYGVEPAGGRRNLLTWSESLPNAAWVKAVTVASGVLDPDGGSTAFTLTAPIANAEAYQEFTGRTVGQANTFQCWMRRRTGSGAIQIYANSTRTTITLTSSWQLITLTENASATTIYFGFRVAVSGDAIDVWHPQFETGSTATNYQRVTTAYDVTESGVPTCHYVQYDGSDDSMSTAAIDFTATDKMSVFAGVRKLSSVQLGIIAELSATAESNNGSGVIFTYETRYAAKFRGSTNAPQFETASVFSAPLSNVLTGLGDIAGDLATLRVNSTQVAQSTADQGTGNFGNYPIYIGRRGNATFPFSGKDYGIIVVGKAASAGEITDTETWLAAKTSGVTL